MRKYEHKKIEKKWRKNWGKSKVYKTQESSDKPKYYVLDMFPYPSGAGLHVGHPKGYIATDVVARMKMMRGFNVLHPMGWDAFGLPAENYAIQNKVHPREATEKNVATFKKQLGLLGFTYDWDREVNTTDSEYYKWTQWTFLQMYKKGLAFESNEPINWCPKCQTGLANEDLDDGKCERCGTVVERKPMRQWVLKITKYADRLLNDIDKLKEWPEPIKEMQRNWIGRSEGAEINFSVIPGKTGIRSSGSPIRSGMTSEEKLKVFTTRPDTIFGATYLVVAPEHSLIENCRSKIDNYAEVEQYVVNARNKSDLERTDLAKEKTGVELKGLKAANPATNDELPIFVADYVITGYGTGAIMAVPAHDERDWEFAKKYNLPVKEVVKSSTRKECFSGEGVAVNSDFLNGLPTSEAKNKIINWLEEKGIGAKKVQYKLRDWVFSRQRYWGEPIPLVHCENCKNKKYKYILLHGYSSSSKSNFLPWLKLKLETQGHMVWIPDLPQADKPQVDEQAQYVLDNSPFAIDVNTVVVGHSLGAVVALKLLEKFDEKIAKVVLVDGFIRPKFSDMPRPDVAESCDWDFNFTGLKNLCDDFVVLSDSRYEVITKGQDQELSKLLDGKLIVVESAGKHFRATEEQEIPVQLVNNGWVPVPENELPLELPKVKNYAPSGTGESPLANIHDWVNTKCPVCGGKATRETNTMPQWAGSCWYYLRYIDPKNKNSLVDKEKEKYWSPVDLYVGGAEHATRHLIYARFWHKFLYDIGVVNYEEPFTRLQNVGLILAEDGRKMSKRWNNVINPDDVVEKFGADAMRIYEMFMGPFDQSCAWSTNGLVGARRFVEKVWSLQEKVSHAVIPAKAGIQGGNSERPDSRFSAQGGSASDMTQNDKLVTLLHQTIKKVSDDIEKMRFNTAISQLMILVNKMSEEDRLLLTPYSLLLKLLSPFAPHLTEELWNVLGNKESIFLSAWPKYDAELAKDSEIILVVQVNGKVRDTIVAPAEISEEEAKKIAVGSGSIQKWLEGKIPKKVIYVKGKLVSIVV